MLGCCSEAGRLFQILGPATEKLLSPSRVFVLGTVRTLAWVERSWGRPESAINWHFVDQVRWSLTSQTRSLTTGVKMTPVFTGRGTACGHGSVYRV